MGELDGRTVFQDGDEDRERGRETHVRMAYCLREEPCQGLLKAAFGYRIFRTHGIKNVETEWMILCMSGIVLRYSMLTAGPALPFWFRIEQQAS